LEMSFDAKPMQPVAERSDPGPSKALDRIKVLSSAGGWYDGEIRETWPAFTAARYLAPDATGSG